MITKSTIQEFFKEECDASDKHIKDLYSLDIKERIKKRKTIDNVTIDFTSLKDEKDYKTVKAIIKNNIADFKVGESLIIHDNNPFCPITTCILYDMLDDGNLLLGFGIYDNLSALEQILKTDPDKKFILDKKKVDLRKIYTCGWFNIKNEHLAIINKVPKPTFSDNRDEVYEEVLNTDKKYNLRLTNAQKEAAVNAMLAEDYYLIQGPPGTGKSFVISVILLECLLYSKEKVLVSGPNHLAINNILVKLLKLNNNLNGITLKVGENFNNFGLEYIDSDGLKQLALTSQYLNVFNCNNWDTDNSGICIGITPFHMHTSRGNGLEFDTLIIDEAGQMNIGLALMAMSCAKKVIFVGDHKQMAPIFSSEDHDVALQSSIFQHLYRDYNCTTLDTTFRMNDCICNVISSTFYDGVLKSSVAGQRLISSRPIAEKYLSPAFPVIVKDIKHNGTNTSDEEADECIDIIKKYVCQYNFSTDSIAVIAPFRAQCALIRKKLRKLKDDIEDYKSILVETVDRMQGQEREIIIISITAGAMDYMSELNNFIFNPNRFNVAISRAKNKLIILGNITNLKKAIGSDDSPWLNQIFESEYIKHF